MTKGSGERRMQPTEDIKKDGDASSVRRSSDSDNDRASTSDSNSSGDETSSDEEVILKPVFIDKFRRAKTVASNDKRSRGLDRNDKALVASKMDAMSQRSTVEMDVFDGVDDTDDIDPEGDYEAWKRREKERYVRDRALLEAQEAAKNDKYRRLRAAEEAIAGQEIKAAESTEQRDGRRPLHRGAFFNDDEEIQSRFLKRDYDDVEDNKDHSRPTRLKF
ncbi:uncharacterized protein PRCAT00000882001 [Priceomyces carsonii]|uniref:uncharacterized protein n=1 Tax=Priceomyces carsonii TaxID=28549 RepID=UPI002ED9E55E|nr:unnamed protein product [Priceomyces carsonii]